MSESNYFIPCNDGKTIETTVTNDASVITRWISEISGFTSQNHQSGAVVVGLDVEWRPNRRSGEDNFVATLQLCVDTTCLIIQLNYLEVFPASLKSFLANPNYLFVGVGVNADVNKLWNDYELQCTSTRDLGNLAVEAYPQMFSSNRPGLKEVANKLVGIWLPKPFRVTMSDWEREVLRYDQVEYAALDAYASCKIGVHLLQGL